MDEATRAMLEVNGGGQSREGFSRVGSMTSSVGTSFATSTPGKQQEYGVSQVR